MFTTLYRPKTIEGFVGNKQIIQPFIHWLLEWNESNKKQKCALFSGMCGIGKSLIVELILKKHDYNIIDISLDNNISKEYMNNIKHLIKTKTTYDSQENVLVVSDIDGFSDHGFISSLTECIKESKIPVICICDNRYDKGIKQILNYCIDFKMSKPSYQDVYRLIYIVVVTEKIKIKESEIKDMYEESNGDIRFILNNLQLGTKKGKKNIQSINIFETTGKLLSIDESIESKYDTFWFSNDLHPLMIQENYINNIMGRDDVKKLENISYSADVLSDVNIFEKCVNMTNWEIEPYVALSAIQSTSKCNKKSMIKFPQILGRISSMYKNKREKLNYEDVEFFEKKETKPKETKPKETKPKETKIKETKIKETKTKVKKETKVKK